MIKIIHAADLHMDSPMEGLGPKAATRRAELRMLPARLAELCREKNADALLLAGDLLDGVRAYPETVAALKSALASLGCPVLIAPGNHDPYRAGSVYAREKFSENVHIFHGELQPVEFPELGLTVWGGDGELPLRGFCCPDNGRINIGILHGDTGRVDNHYGFMPPEDIAASGLDYLALGHIHAASGLQREGNTYWAYPGCPEGRGFDECGEKGILYLEIEPGQVRAEFIPLGKRRYEIIELDITEGLPAAPAGHDKDICRIILTGEPEFAPDLAALHSAWADKFFALQLRDATRLRRDIWEDAGQDSLRGLFIRKIREKYDRETDEADRKRLENALRWGLAALEGGEAIESI